MATAKTEMFEDLVEKRGVASPSGQATERKAADPPTKWALSTSEVGASREGQACEVSARKRVVVNKKQKAEPKGKTVGHPTTPTTGHARLTRQSAAAVTLKKPRVILVDYTESSECESAESDTDSDCEEYKPRRPIVSGLPPMKIRRRNAHVAKAEPGLQPKPCKCTRFATRCAVCRKGKKQVVRNRKAVEGEHYTYYDDKVVCKVPPCRNAVFQTIRTFGNHCCKKHGLICSGTSKSLYALDSDEDERRHSYNAKRRKPPGQKICDNYEGTRGSLRGRWSQAKRRRRNAITRKSVSKFDANCLKHARPFAPDEEDMFILILKFVFPMLDMRVWDSLVDPKDYAGIQRLISESHAYVSDWAKMVFQNVDNLPDNEEAKKVRNVALVLIHIFEKKSEAPGDATIALKTLREKILQDALLWVQKKHESMMWELQHGWHRFEQDAIIQYKAWKNATRANSLQIYKQNVVTAFMTYKGWTQEEAEKQVSLESDWIDTSDDESECTEVPNEDSKHTQFYDDDSMIADLPSFENVVHITAAEPQNSQSATHSKAAHLPSKENLSSPFTTTAAELQNSDSGTLPEAAADLPRSENAFTITTVELENDDSGTEKQIPFQCSEDVYDAANVEDCQEDQRIVQEYMDRQNRLLREKKLKQPCLDEEDVPLQNCGIAPGEEDAIGGIGHAHDMEVNSLPEVATTHSLYGHGSDAGIVLPQAGQSTKVDPAECTREVWLVGEDGTVYVTLPINSDVGVGNGCEAEIVIDEYPRDCDDNLCENDEYVAKLLEEDEVTRMVEEELGSNHGTKAVEADVPSCSHSQIGTLPGDSESPQQNLPLQDPSELLKNTRTFATHGPRVTRVSSQCAQVQKILAQVNGRIEDLPEPESEFVKRHYAQFQSFDEVWGHAIGLFADFKERCAWFTCKAG